MSLILLFLPSRDVKYITNGVLLENGSDYEYIVKVKSSISQNVSISVVAADGTISDNYSQYVPANTWTTLKNTFTAVKTDSDSRLQIHFATTASTVYVDDIKITNLTKSRKNYRIMGIKGQMTPGNFTQTLTLREVTANETA